MAYIASKKDDPKQFGYVILHGTADQFPSLSAMREATGMPLEYPGMKMEKRYEFVMYTCIGKESLKAEKNSTL